jgi:hypothetical protein
MLALLLLAVLPVRVLYPEPGHAWVFLPFGWMGEPYRWIVLPLLLMTSLAALWGGPRAPPRGWRVVVAAAPWVIGALWIAPACPSGVRAFVSFQLPVLWLAALVLQATRHGRGGGPPPTRRDAGVVFALSLALYTASGLYYTKACGAHAGDEGYYLIQVRSLCEDGDTDIGNNLTHRSRHLSPFSRPPHKYTYHAPGLPFLLAPLQPLGLAGRHLVLGAIASLGLLAVLGLCRHFRLPRGASLLVVALHAFSIHWGVYSSRCLPEVLGATLVALAFWAGVRQSEHPWRSAALAALSIAYLPLANIRFTPVAVGCALLYVLMGTTDARTWRERRSGLLAWAGLLLLGAGLMQVYQWSRFTGGLSHPVGRMLLSNPSGMWKVLTHEQGLTNLYPALPWLLAANLWWAVRVPSSRWVALGSVGLFAGVLLTSCAVPDWNGGTALGGRFLVVALPVLLPGAVWAWTRATDASRYALVVLAGLSVALWFWQLALLPHLGHHFARPWTELPERAPALVGLRPVLAAPGLLVVLAAGVFLLVGWPTARPAAAWSLLALVGATVLLAQARWGKAWPEPAYAAYARRPGDLAEQLAALPLECYARSSRGLRPAVDLFHLSNRFGSRTGHASLAAVVTSRDAHPSGPVIDLSSLEVNDWRNRPLRWATLREPFPAGRGERALRLRGRIEGSVRAHLAVREGSVTLLEEPLESGPGGLVARTVVVSCRGRGHVYLLLRLEGGEGAFVGEHIAWSPYSSRAFPAAGVTLTAMP